MAEKILILLGSSSDLPITEDGINHLKKAKIPFRLHIASAHRSPQRVHDLVTEFDQKGGQVVICCAGMSAHLAGVVASLTTKPVLAVPISRTATSGLDSLLSVSQMPPGIPVATMPFDKPGFTNACIFSQQVIALGNASQQTALQTARADMIEKIISQDREHGVRFEG